MPRGKHGSGQRRNRHFTRNSPFSLSEIHAATDFSIKNDAVNSQTIAQLQAAAPLGERVFLEPQVSVFDFLEAEKDVSKNSRDGFQYTRRLISRYKMAQSIPKQ